MKNTDPVKKGKKGKKAAKTHVAKSSSGGKVEITKKSVDMAKSKQGPYRPDPYKGGPVKDDSGKVMGYRTHNGKFYRADAPNSGKARRSEAAYMYDRALHTQEEGKRSKMTKNHSVAKRKGG